MQQASFAVAAAQSRRLTANASVYHQDHLLQQIRVVEINVLNELEFHPS